MTDPSVARPGFARLCCLFAILPPATPAPPGTPRRAVHIVGEAPDVTGQASPQPRGAALSGCAAGSAAVVGVDTDVVVRQVAGPHRGGRLATMQQHTHRDFTLLHHALAVGLAVIWIDRKSVV